MGALSQWAMLHGATPEHADAFALLVVIFGSIACVLLLAHMFGGSGVSGAIEERVVNGRVHIRHPTLGWFGALHSRTTGTIEGWESCKEPQDLDAPPDLIMPDGTRRKLGR